MVLAVTMTMSVMWVWQEGGGSSRMGEGVPSSHRAGTHLGLASGLGAQAVWGAVELLRHHTQELGLVLTPIVVGGADVHQLE